MYMKREPVAGSRQPGAGSSELGGRSCQELGAAVGMGVDGHVCKEKGRSVERPFSVLSPYLQDSRCRGKKMPTLLRSGGAEVVPYQRRLLWIFCWGLDSFSEGDAGRVSEVESSGMPTIRQKQGHCPRSRDCNCSRRCSSVAREIDFCAAQSKDKRKRAGVARAIGPIEEDEPALAGVALELE